MPQEDFRRASQAKLAGMGGRGKLRMGTKFLCAGACAEEILLSASGFQFKGGADKFVGGDLL